MSYLLCKTEEVTIFGQWKSIGSYAHGNNYYLFLSVSKNESSSTMETCTKNLDFSYCETHRGWYVGVYPR